MMDQEKAEERLNQRNKVWNEVIESRRWKVQQIYGRKAAEKYHFLTREKNFFYSTDTCPPIQAKRAITRLKAYKPK